MLDNGGEAEVSNLRRGRILLVVSVLIMSWMVFSETTSDARPVLSVFPTSSSNAQPLGIALGSDGAMWFTERDANNIGRISPDGAVSEFPVPTPKSGPESIAAASDGTLWFTEIYGSKIGRITTSGQITEYSVAYPGPWDITAGPDGAMWFTEQPGSTRIGRIDLSGTISEFPAIRSGTANGIVAGPDGALWFTNPGNNSIARLTTSGDEIEYILHGDAGPTSPAKIVTGPDGALWFTQYSSNEIGRITTSGQIQEYRISQLPIYGVGPYSIASGPDGALWFTEHNGTGPNNDRYSVGRITTTGDVSQYQVPDGETVPNGIASGNSDTLWFADGTDHIGKIAIVPDPPWLSATANPTNIAPQLNWQPIEGALRYNIYRDGTIIATTPATTYTDLSAPEGNYTYSVSASSKYAESYQSNSIYLTFDKTPPSISALSISQKQVSVNSPALVTATATDTLSGVVGGEYFVDSDPGLGNAPQMDYSSNQLSATLYGSNLRKGKHTLYVRAKDATGNWSKPLSVTFISN